MNPSEAPTAPVVSFDDEPLIVVDNKNQVVDFRSKLDCHLGEGILHRAFSVFLFDDQGRLLLQKRSSSKPLWPLFWSNSCCSHPRQGEAEAEAATRRIGEELGVSSRLRSLFTFRYHARFLDRGSEHEMCEVFVGRAEGEVRSNVNEIAKWKWIGIADFEQDLQQRPARYTPWLHLEWDRIRKHHWAALEGIGVEPA